VAEELLGELYRSLRSEDGESPVMELLPELKELSYPASDDNSTGETFVAFTGIDRCTPEWSRWSGSSLNILRLALVVNSGVHSEHCSQDWRVKYDWYPHVFIYSLHTTSSCLVPAGLTFTVSPCTYYGDYVAYIDHLLR